MVNTQWVIDNPVTAAADIEALEAKLSEAVALLKEASYATTAGSAMGGVRRATLADRIDVFTSKAHNNGHKQKMNARVQEDICTTKNE